MVATSGYSKDEASPIYVRMIPAGYRDWKLAPFGKEGRRFPTTPSFLESPGPTSLRRRTTTGGWGYAQFDDGKPADEKVMKTCFPCHRLNKARDHVFTRYSP
jgi:hypothetical protein